jgi:16S rRNA (guanine527-N7)-methyltransferase
MSALTLERGCAALGLDLGARELAQLNSYLDLLEKWNRVHNLTAIREREQMITHHVLDSLAVVKEISSERVLDVGSGAGLPGIPWAIAKSSSAVTVLDSNHKKAAFLRQAVGELQLKNVSVVAERVEQWQTKERFAVIVSRALSDLAEFVALARPLLAADGLFVAMKGVHPYEEIERLPADIHVQRVVKLTVPGLDAERHLVLLRPS